MVKNDGGERAEKKLDFNFHPFVRAYFVCIEVSNRLCVQMNTKKCD